MRRADNLPPSCAVVMKSGNLNLLEPSGPLQACNGTAFTFFIQFNLFGCIEGEFGGFRSGAVRSV